MKREVLVLDVSKEGCESSFEKFINKHIRQDMREILLKDSFLVERTYIHAFDEKIATIEDCIRHYSEGQLEGSLEDCIREVTEKIEAAREICLNKLKEQFANEGFNLGFNIKYCDKETINVIVDFLNSLNQKGIKPNIIIRHDAYGFEKEELLNLMDLREFLQEDFNITEKFKNKFGFEEEKEEKLSDDSILGKGDFSFDRTVEAYKKMEDEIKKIESLNLSPFEKFLYVHDFVANRIYNEQPREMSSHESRDFVNAMTGDYIVCVGYAEIMENFCNRLGIECKVISGFSRNKGECGHAANVVKIVDEKYGIDGEYFCDACYDSRKEHSRQGIFYAALPLQDIKHIEQSKFFDKRVENYSGKKESKPIPLKAFQEALTSVYSKTDGENFNENKISGLLSNAVDDAKKYSDGDNAFSACVRYKRKIYEAVTNNEKLNYKMLRYIFHNIHEKDKLSKTILRLLYTLEGEKLDNFVDLLNKDFTYSYKKWDLQYSCENKLLIPALYLFEKSQGKSQELETIKKADQDIDLYNFL